MISIVVMLILAGVSLNATVGENGILTRAQNAKKTQELAQTKEELEYMFFDYNTGENDTKTISEFLNGKVASGDIDEFKVYPIDGDLKMVIKKGDNYFYVRKDGEYYSATQMETTLDDIQSGFTVVTEDSFSNLEDGSMKFNLSGDQSSTLIFYDEINDSFNFDILGGNVSIYVTQNMTLTNKNLSRSAIDVHSGATLNLYIYDGVTMNVDSGYGRDALEGTPGKGGYAGIHVPEGATLNLYGEGTIKAFGGKASNGGDVNWSRNDVNWSSKIGAGGGRSWCWYWRKWRRWRNWKNKSTSRNRWQIRRKLWKC